MLAGSKETHVTKERRGRTKNGRAGARPAVSDTLSAAGGPRDVAGLAEALASMERRLAEMQARLDGLDASIEARRRTERELDIQIAIRKGALELLGKEPGADPEKARPAARRRSSSRPLARRWALPPGVCCPWSASRAARTITRSTP